ncbi:unnamed protein product [Meloidogyne enterolobii]|uniref:Uncharacterized protein n=1 Tax=Meloidogyne enterolobii TaxID=390850 RepID=A0ACB0YCM5_MELEN
MHLLNLFLFIIGIFLIQNFENSLAKTTGKTLSPPKGVVNEEQAKQQICQGNLLFSLCISQAYSECAWCNDGNFKGKYRCDTKSSHKGKCKDLL